MSNDNRPKPPRPLPPPLPPASEPTIPGARAPSDAPLRAAGISRSRMHSEPNQRAAADASMLHAAIQKLGEGQAAHASTFRALAQHHERTQEHDQAQDAALVVLARAMGVEHQLPPQIQRSNRPPPMAAKPSAPPKPKLDVIEKDAKAGTNATYVTLAILVVQLLLEVIRHLGAQ